MTRLTTTLYYPICQKLSTKSWLTKRRREERDIVLEMRSLMGWWAGGEKEDVFMTGGD